MVKHQEVSKYYENDCRIKIFMKQLELIKRDDVSLLRNTSKLKWSLVISKDLWKVSDLRAKLISKKTKKHLTMLVIVKKLNVHQIRLFTIQAIYTNILFCLKVGILPLNILDLLFSFTRQKI